MGPNTADALRLSFLACGSADAPPRPPVLELLMPDPSPCLHGCDYPVGECSGACLAPIVPPARHHGLPIDLVEPCPARAEGDRVPCHLSMPEVAWPQPVGPVIRMRPRREHWLTEAPARPVADGCCDECEPDYLGRVAALLVCFWCLGATLLVAAHLKGWL